MRFVQLASRAVLSLIAVAILTCPAAALPELRIAGQGELATFPFWIAKEKGWDKEEGFDMALLYFDSGMSMLNTLPSGEWSIGVAGAGLMGGLRYNTYIIAIGNDDGPATGVLVRPDSQLLKTKGQNAALPEVFGKAEDMKGKTILTTTVSTAHYTVSRWLNSQGLQDKDMVIKNMDQAQVISAFDNKIGDVISVWTPFLQIGESKGWKRVADGSKLDAGIGVWVMCDKKFGDTNPEMVAKALRVYMRGVNMLRNEPMQTLLPVYKKFATDYCGTDLSDELLTLSIKASPVYSHEKQLQLFNADSGESQVQKWLAGFAEFLATSERISKAELDSIKGINFATDRFLKMVELPIPSYK